MRKGKNASRRGKTPGNQGRKAEVKRRQVYGGEGAAGEAVRALEGLFATE